MSSEHREKQQAGHRGWLFGHQRSWMMGALQRDFVTFLLWVPKMAVAGLRETGWTTRFSKVHTGCQMSDISEY